MMMMMTTSDTDNNQIDVSLITQ